MNVACKNSSINFKLKKKQSREKNLARLPHVLGVFHEISVFPRVVFSFTLALNVEVENVFIFFVVAGNFLYLN